MSSPVISEEELDEIYAFAIQLGKDAGKMLMDAAALRMSSSSSSSSSSGEADAPKWVEKDNAVDIVTKTDTGMSVCSLTDGSFGTDKIPTDVEAFIHSSIAKKYPHHQYVVFVTQMTPTGLQRYQTTYTCATCTTGS